MTAFVPALSAGALVLASLLLRVPALEYSGPPAPHPMSVFLMAHAGAYSDIAHLYFRDRLWEHPVPYVDYRFEYPVLTGAFVWLAASLGSTLPGYLLVSAALLLCLAVVTVWVVGRIDGANPWIFAAAPALAFYAVLNWDLLGVCLLAVALLLFQRERDGAGGAVLALATWAKFFPIVILPLVLALRAADRRWRSVAATSAAFAAVTVLVNAPFAVGPGGIRSSWTYFFSFTATRPPRATIWRPLLGHGADFVSDPLILAGLVAIVVLALRARGRSGGTLIPGSATALLLVFALSKVYSPQYALWIFLLLAVTAVPVRLAVAFALVDVLLFTTTFGPLYPGLPLVSVQWAADGLRQLATAGLALWVLRLQLGYGSAELTGAGRRFFARLPAS